MTELVVLDSVSGRIRALAEELAAAILDDQLIVLPTDTTYALCSNALSESAVRKIFLFKGRSSTKPVSIAVSSVDMATRYATITVTARQLMRRFLPGPLTVVLNHNNRVPRLLVADLPTVGIRIPAQELVLECIRAARVPITITSANISGEDPCYSVEDLMAQVPLATFEQLVSVVVDGGVLRSGALSTIVDCSVEPVRTLREGSIGREEIEAALVAGDPSKSRKGAEHALP